ncbi:Lrp/AsnC family transcriptional regulator [Methylocystis parvus]|uniref:Lrp/AsnC family transcriptional regulator n=1 Tax=Methylocystis parvus TaxID=134 RepID=A0A6B8M3F6_9HYPH|nr:Lrp/AsnC family transcriptional regulator [Methylocystis parvus]QGM97421.1 Lrp/AsnC family transcriptional regulator [Methylocystis parvus]WBJ98665.1 Lrp/AsnC family transcriptional regulator [Methylocystis parvus OBBP]
MDAIDLKILALLQQDATRPISEIATSVHLSQTPCWKRIQRLEAEGVIKRRVALLDPQKLRLHLTAYVSIVAGEHSDQWFAVFSQFIESRPEVVEFHRMAGDVDYILCVVTQDMVAYDAFYKQLVEVAKPLRSVVSRFAMETIKASTALPLPRVDESGWPRVGAAIELRNRDLRERETLDVAG